MIDALRATADDNLVRSVVVERGEGVRRRRADRQVERPERLKVCRDKRILVMATKFFIGAVEAVDETRDDESQRREQPRGKA